MSNEVEKMIAEICLKISRLIEKIDRLESLIAGSPIHVEGWAKPNKAAKALQADGIENLRELQRLRLEGVFSEDKGEIRNRAKGKKAPRWEYHIPKCRKALEKHFRRS